MSWDVLLFSSKEPVYNIEDLDESNLIPIHFPTELEIHFTRIKKDGEHREITGENFSIDFFTSDEPVNTLMLSLYGEPALFELIFLAKIKGWQIFDTFAGEIINLENPEENGYENFKNYVSQISRL